MDPQSAALLAKDIGAGLATIGVAGAGVGIGNLFGAFVSAVGRNVQFRQGLESGPAGSVEMSQCDQVISEGSRLVAGPGVEGGDEGGLGDAGCRDGSGSRAGMKLPPKRKATPSKDHSFRSPS